MGERWDQFKEEYRKAKAEREGSEDKPAGMGISAVVIRADGSKEDLGEIAHGDFSVSSEGPGE